MWCHVEPNAYNFGASPENRNEKARLLSLTEIRHSSIETQDTDEDEDVQDRLMTHSLFMAQQAARECLVIAEEECSASEEQTEADGLSSPQVLSPGGKDLSSASQRRHKRFPMPYITPRTQANEPIDRLSTVLSRSFNPQRSVSNTNTSFMDESRLSILQTDELLRQWTDQSDPLAASIRDSSLDLTQISPTDPRFPDVGATEGHSIAEPEPSNENSPKEEGEIFKSLRVNPTDPCCNVLPQALRRYNIEADRWREYELYIVASDLERVVSLEEKPLLLFREYDRDGKKPVFMVRKRTQSPL
ncbi:MAG: hypothetical protein Q9160_000453 [Pyrenula sp. 1 TL-2023]